MDQRLVDVLNQKAGNYIFPFLWMRGEAEPVLREEMRRVHGSGIGAVCVEARPHPDFAGPGWWRDMDIILDEAEKLGMKVWILDDVHFPTGFANGWIRDKFPEHGKRYLTEQHVDVCGPVAGASFIIDGWLNQKDRNRPEAPHFTDDRLVAVVAARRPGVGDDIAGEVVSLTGQVRNGTLYWDVPEGIWRIFILTVSRNGGGDPDYINIIDASSVRILIDAVYEPHFQRYGHTFGKVIAGFFSDEPGFGNIPGYHFDGAVGRRHMVLPWCSELEQAMEAALGEDFHTLLPSLWFDGGQQTSAVRYHYMNIVSTLYGRNFCGQLGAWCRERGVAYIGHIIEDNNVNTRLGCGAGHFFRALGGQDMSGVDVVNHQIIPGFDQAGFACKGRNWDGEFFHYALAKMGASLGHMDPLKKGRTLCELFGAYGWSEGLKMMKWLTDHMLVRGVNHLVPHAFSPQTFPDPDCPPHFYAHGNNPQYPYFGELMRYANRVCHLLNGGVHRATAAILYHAEAEWSGGYGLVQEPARLLAQHQIDYDILPADIFARPDHFGTSLQRNQLAVHEEIYRCLIVPFAAHVTCETARFIEKAQQAGLPVIFLEGFPEGICGEPGAAVPEEVRQCICLEKDMLVPYLMDQGLFDIRTDVPQPYLRSYCYQRGDSLFRMFFNEDPVREISTELWLPELGTVCRYDAFRNRLTAVNAVPADGGLGLRLMLAPYESALLVIGGSSDMEAMCVPETRPRRHSPLDTQNPWTVTLLPVNGPETQCRMDTLADIGAPDRHPDFSGTVRYETTLTLETDMPEGLDLGHAFETAEVFVNGISAGVRICPPYRFDTTGLFRSGRNSLRVEVITHLGRAQRDRFSKTMMLEPVGLLGPVSLEY